MGYLKRYFFSEVDSTQTLLRAWAEAGAPSGTLVWAHTQRAGYGRKGTAWYASPGESLTFSLLWRERFSPATLLVRVALALYDALAPYLCHSVFLKWPNDLWSAPDPLGKLAGILGETKWEGAQPQYALIGVGLNVYQTQFPPGLCAVSLAQIGVPPPSMEHLLDRFEPAFLRWMEAPEENVKATFLHLAWREGRLCGEGGNVPATLVAWEGDWLYFETPKGGCILSTVQATEQWKPTLSV